MIRLLFSINIVLVLGTAPMGGVTWNFFHAFRRVATKPLFSFPKIFGHTRRA
jgi:hypothetical protein